PDHPEWIDGNQHRRQSTWHRLLGPYDGAVTEADEEHAADDERQPLAPRWKRLAAQPKKYGEQSAREEPPRSRHKQRWNGFERDADAEVCRSPHQAQNEPGQIGAAFRQSPTRGSDRR